MAKLKVGQGKDGKKPAKSKKPKSVEEITLDSSSEGEASDAVMEVSSNDEDEPMEVSDQKVNGTKEFDINDDTSDKVDKNGDSETSPKENGDADKDLKSNLSNGTTDISGTTGENGQEISKKDASDSDTKDQVNEVTTIEETDTKYPALRPGHVWTSSENKAIFQHLVPRVAMTKLKHTNKYFYDKNAEYTNEDRELDVLLDKVEGNTIMELFNGDSAVITPSGYTFVLPPNYKQLIKSREKRAKIWETESDWQPKLSGPGRKLNLANVKLGPSVKQPKIVLDKIDPK